MPKSIKKEISKAFVKGGDEFGYANDYLSELRINWRENEKSITRASGLMVGLAVIFEITFGNKTATATFLGVNLSETVTIKFGLPVAIAYFYHSLAYSLIESAIFRQTHDALMKIIYPAIYDADFEWQLHPAGSLEDSVDRVHYALGADTPVMKLIGITGGARPLTIFVGPPIFLVIAYIQLFVKYGSTYPLLWVSAVVAAILLISGVIETWLTP